MSISKNYTWNLRKEPEKYARCCEQFAGEPEREKSRAVINLSIHSSFNEGVRRSESLPYVQHVSTMSMMIRTFSAVQPLDK